jgi:transducin (beta)-like 1
MRRGQVCTSFASWRPEAAEDAPVCPSACAAHGWLLIARGRGHTNEINQVRFHAQQQLLATCSDDRTARIWRLQDILARARGGVAEPDGAGADSETDPSIVLRGHKNNVSTVDWCPAQPGGAVLLVTTSFDGTTRLWDSETGACQRTFADHKTPVFAVKLSPDGRWLATGGGDGLLFVYDIAVRSRALGVRVWVCEC